MIQQLIRPQLPRGFEKSLRRRLDLAECSPPLRGGWLWCHAGNPVDRDELSKEATVLSHFLRIQWLCPTLGPAS
jgi:hypothetical protein